MREKWIADAKPTTKEEVIAEGDRMVSMVESRILHNKVLYPKTQKAFSQLLARNGVASVDCDGYRTQQKCLIASHTLTINISEMYERKEHNDEEAKLKNMVKAPPALMKSSLGEDFGVPPLEG